MHVYLKNNVATFHPDDRIQFETTESEQEVVTTRRTTTTRV